MNWLSWEFGFVSVIYIGTAGLFLLAAAFLCWRGIETRRQVLRLSSDVALFAEASMRVADTVDQILVGRATPLRASHTSRRYLLSRARDGISSGDSLDQIAVHLGLSHDEVSLLQRMQPLQGLQAANRTSQAA